MARSSWQDRTSEGGNTIALARLLGDSDQSSAAANNQAPVNSVPPSQSTVIDVPLAFTAYSGNGISLSDPDAGNLEVEVTLARRARGW